MFPPLYIQQVWEGDYSTNDALEIIQILLASLSRIKLKLRNKSGLNILHPTVHKNNIEKV